MLGWDYYPDDEREEAEDKILSCKEDAEKDKRSDVRDRLINGLPVPDYLHPTLRMMRELNRSIAARQK